MSVELAGSPTAAMADPARWLTEAGTPPRPLPRIRAGRPGSAFFVVGAGGQVGLAEQVVGGGLRFSTALARIGSSAGGYAGVICNSYRR
jgi:hypothetical protein